jgi:hypothetical protein
MGNSEHSVYQGVAELSRLKHSVRILIFMKKQPNTEISR